MKKLLLFLFLVLVPAVATADELDKYMELLRSDLRTTKVELLTEELKMTEAQAAKFWPIQRAYETDLAANQDARLTMIKEYAKNYTMMNDAIAKTLTEQAFKLQEQRTSLLKKTTSKVSKEVSPMVAARFAQVESFVQSLVDVKVRGEVPVIP